jgi:hypothetical protein
MRNILPGNGPRFHIEISLLKREGRCRIKIFGWICCRVEVHKLHIEINQTKFDSPVGFPRLDVYKSINPDHAYPFINSFFSGIDSEYIFPIDLLDKIQPKKFRALISEKDGTVLSDVSFELVAEKITILSG